MAITKLNKELIVERGYEIRDFTYDGSIGGRSEKHRRKGLWVIERMNGESKVFLTCPGCASITALSRAAAIDSRGHVYDPSNQSLGCVVCAKCNSHFFVHLKGWKDRSKGERREIERFETETDL